MTPSEPASAPFSRVQFAVLRFVTIASVADWLAAIPMLARSIKSRIGLIRILFIDEPQYSTPRPCVLYECDTRNFKVADGRRVLRLVRRDPLQHPWWT